MLDYKTLYLKLFNATEDAINAMEDAAKTMDRATKELIRVQQECEELYITDPDPDPGLRVLPFQAEEQEGMPAAQ